MCGKYNGRVIGYCPVLYLVLSAKCQVKPTEKNQLLEFDYGSMCLYDSIVTATLTLEREDTRI